MSGVMHKQWQLYSQRLERNLRERTEIIVYLSKDGGIFITGNRRTRYSNDGHASVILRMYREHLMSKDNFFLAETGIR